MQPPTATGRENPFVRAAAFWSYAVLVAIYGAWRVLATWPMRPGGDHAIAGAFYLLLEATMILAGLRILRLLKSRVRRSGDADRDAGWWQASGPSPVLDVLIPTYDESETILEKSVAGAKQLIFGELRIWVLDDGNREGVRALCARMAVNYLARAEHSHAKAGNLNHALAHLEKLPRGPELVLVIDADVVAQPQLAHRALALMKDPGVGLVQTPQFFWNPDPFQAAFPGRRAVTDDLRLSFDVLHVALDARGQASCRGTSFLVRAEALKAIGGFPTESVAEDVLTSQRLRAAGWRTVYLDEPLSFGLAAESLEQYLRQRQRWSTGFAQIGRRGWSAGASLSLVKRAGSVVAGLRWQFTNLVQALMIFVPPLCYWFFDAPPYRADARAMLLLGLPPLLLYRGYMTWFSEGRALPIFREANLLVQLPALVSGAVAGFFSARARPFLVTSKGLKRGRMVVHRRFVAWLAVLVAASAAGPIHGMTRSAARPGFDLMHTLMLSWSAYGCVVGLLAMFICFERLNRRDETRFAGNGELGRISFGDGVRAARVIDVSCSGALVQVLDDLPPTSPPHADSRIQTQLSLAGVEGIDAVVVRRPSPRLFALRFTATGRTRERLICTVLSARFLSPAVRGSFVGASAAAVRRLFGAAAELVHQARFSRRHLSRPPRSVAGDPEVPSRGAAVTPRNHQGLSSSDVGSPGARGPGRARPYGRPYP